MKKTKKRPGVRFPRELRLIGNCRCRTGALWEMVQEKGFVSHITAFSAEGAGPPEVEQLRAWVRVASK